MLRRNNPENYFPTLKIPDFLLKWARLAFASIFFFFFPVSSLRQWCIFWCARCKGKCNNAFSREENKRGGGEIWEGGAVGKPEKLELLHKKLCVMKVQDYPIKDITSFRSWNMHKSFSEILPGLFANEELLERNLYIFSPPPPSYKFSFLILLIQWCSVFL